MPTSNGGPGYFPRGSFRSSWRSSSARHEGRASGSRDLRRGRNCGRRRALRNGVGATHGVAIANTPRHLRRQGSPRAERSPGDSCPRCSVARAWTAGQSFPPWTLLGPGGCRCRPLSSTTRADEQRRGGVVPAAWQARFRQRAGGRRLGHLGLRLDRCLVPRAFAPERVQPAHLQARAVVVGASHWRRSGPRTLLARQCDCSRRDGAIRRPRAAA